MKFISLLLFFSFFTLDACTDRQKRDSRIAEQLYVELLEALYKGQLKEAKLAATDLDIQLDKLNAVWRRPMPKQALEDCRYHLDQARAVYGDMLMALQSGNTELARIQLDRATYELYVADPQAFELLYMGKAYFFFTNWQEVYKIINDQMLCLMEWTEYAWWANTALAAWEEAACYAPNKAIYKWSKAEQERFREAQLEMDLAIGEFKQSIPLGEQLASQQAADDVNKALWELLSLLKATPSEKVLAN